VVALLASGALAADLREQTRWDLEHQGALLAMLVERELAHATGASVADVAPQVGPLLVAAKERTRSGLRLVDADAVVVASSNEVVGEDLSGQSEVESALAGRIGTEVRPRPQPSARQPIASESRRAGVRLSVAVPVSRDGEVVGAIVLSRTPREELQALLVHMGPGVLGAAVAGALGAVGLALLAATVATRSLQVLGRGAGRIAAGDLAGVEDLARPERSRVAEVATTAGAVVAMTARLRERLAYIGEFAGHVAHEFKTPLATLQGTFELLADEDDMPPDQRRRFVRNGAGEVERLRRLVDGLLSLARADQVEADGRVSLGAVARDVADRHGVPIEGEAGEVRGDRAELSTVLDNLVRNAFEHGGAEVRPRIELFAAPGRFGARVIDDGPGISPANLPRVFDRFFTTRRAAGGTGLGLAFVRAVCRRSGGDASVESRPGRTVFAIELPRAAP
jgi:signal transduction histidine kinase